MSEQEIFDQIKTIILDKFDIEPDKITKDLNFKDDLNADSIDLVEFILELEDTFGLEISDEEASDKIKTLGDVIEYIKANVK